MNLRYTLVGCPLGRLLLAGTENGVTAICLDDADGPLEAALAARYPAAERVRDDRAVRAWAAEVVNHLRGRQPRLDLPVDVPGTPFQRQVWEELRRIPFGSTLTYTAVARAVGRPAAVRAVARACATNPVALIVPCHRVIREDGGLGGYRWGLERKRRLIDQERRLASCG